MTPPEVPDPFRGDVVLGLDLGAACGVAVTPVGGGPKITRRFTLPNPKKALPNERMAAWALELEALFDEFTIIAVGYEDPGFQVKAAGQIWIRRQEGFLMAFCAGRQIICVPVHSSTVKGFAWKHGAERPKAPKGKKLPDGEQKRAVLRGAISRGWLPPECEGKGPAMDEADAAWVAEYVAVISLGKESG